MRKIIAAINMTIDGNCDHTAGLADEELHQHYADLLESGDLILYGRITYQLMQYWQELIINPSGEETMDNFARSIDKLPKIVFSQTLKDTGWETAKLATKPLEQLVADLKKETGKDIFVGSRSLIIQLLNLNLIDEFQLCVQPVTGGKGLMLFEDIHDKILFKLEKTKTFTNGSIILYYKPVK